MKDPVTGVSSLKFIGRCYIDADIGCIPAKCGPDFPATLAEGDGRTPMFSQQEVRPAEWVADHVNGKRSAFERKPAFPKRTIHPRNVIQQEGDQAILIFFPVRPAPFVVFTITRQGCIERGSPAMIKTHGMDGNALAILTHVHSNLCRAALFRPQTSKNCS
jgi:hypothetical protein